MTRVWNCDVVRGVWGDVRCVLREVWSFKMRVSGGSCKALCVYGMIRGAPVFMM